ncbi:glycosyltransferase family 4 protein [Desulforhopalus sp. 52FAK]
MKVLLLSRYGSLGASSRVRFLQYLPYLQSKGVEVTDKPLLSDAYLQALYCGDTRWVEVVTGYTGRVLALLGVRRFDVVIIEKELFPFMPATAERILQCIGVPYIVDYDDALFHQYDCHSNPWVRRLLGQKIDLVMRHATTVIVGNNYLAERAYRAGASSVEIIPTVVDTLRYQSKQKLGIETPIVGWIGTPKTSHYLKTLLPVFESLKKEMSVRFVAVGVNTDDFKDTPVEAWSWSEDSEVESVQQFDVGIMPLVDSPWERGKCGYKLIQYMACGLPVVVSPVGVNLNIINSGDNGLFAESVEEWEQALRQLIQAKLSERKRMGKAGRSQVESCYSLQAQAPRFYKVMCEARH